MKNKFLIAAFLSASLLIAPNVKAASYTDNQTVDINKTWTIKFTGNVKVDDSAKQGITVTDSKGSKVDIGIQIGKDNKTVKITAPQGGYTSGESYTLVLGTNTHSTKGKTLKKEYLLHFNVKSNAPTATVEQVGTAIMGKTVVVASLTSDVEASQYDVKIDGKALTYDETTKKYTITLDGTFTKEEIQAKMAVTKPLSVEVFKKLDSDKKVAIYFDSAMDVSSITDKNNYYYINGDGDAEDLPDNVNITVSSDNKSVVLDFEDANKTVNPSATSGADVVKKIGIKTVKDASGNEVYPGALTIASASTNSVNLEGNTFKLYKNGDDVKAEFKLDNALDTVNVADFKVSGIAADDADFDGDKVTLTFNEGDKAGDVLALGSSAELQISPSSTDPSEDMAGRTIKAATQKVYYNNIAPETDRDNYKATVTVDASGNVTGAQVYITLKTPVDTDILGAYKDDFLFTNATKGTSLDVESVKLVTSGSEPTLVYTIKDAAKKVAVGDKIDITASSDEDAMDLRSEEDGNGNNVKFVPTSDDLIVKTVKVTEVNK